MRKILFATLLFCLFVSLTSLSVGQQGGQGIPIPQSFWGMTVSQFCDMSSASPCTSGFSFPGMPFNWGRTLGTGITWNRLELCDPTGNWCPLPGSGCAKTYTTTGSGAEGGLGTYNHYTNLNGVSVTCLRPNGVDGNAATVCLSGILCIASGSGTFPCIPNAKAATDPTNCAYTWNFDTLHGQTDQFDQFVGAYAARGLGVQGPNVGLMLNLSVTPDFLSIQGSRCTGSHMSKNGTDTTCWAKSYSTSTSNTFCASEPNMGGINNLTPVPLIFAPSGGCVQPYDADSSLLVGNGLGADTNLQNFMIALFAHMNTTLVLGVPEFLGYIEIGNEPNVCTQWNHKDGISGSGSGAGPCPGTAQGALTNPPATANDLVRMSADVRAIANNTTTYNLTGWIPKIVSAPLVGSGSFTGYLSTILNDESTLCTTHCGAGVSGTTNQFDLIGFHGYYTPANPTSTNNGFCTNEPASTGTVLTNCPVPETFTQLWSELFFVLSNNLTCGSFATCNPYFTTPGVYIPTIDSEFAWSPGAANVVNADQRAAQAAVSYILQAQFYPEIQAVGWYGEDFLPPTTPPPAGFCWNNVPAGCGTGPGGSTGQLWSPTSVAAGPDNDTCTTGATSQGGKICAAGKAMEVVNAWLGQTPSVTRGFVSASSGQTCTCTGPNCSATPPSGVWSCPLKLSGTTSNCTSPTTAGYCGSIVWDSTALQFPCGTTTHPSPCGATTYTLPAWVHATGATPQWQDLNGDTPAAIGAMQSTVTIGAKPILIENQAIATKVTPVD